MASALSAHALIEFAGAISSAEANQKFDCDILLGDGSLDGQALADLANSSGIAAFAPGFDLYSDNMIRGYGEREVWQIALYRGDVSSRALADAILVEPGQNAFAADPFLVGREGTTFLFYEDYGLSRRKGVTADDIDGATGVHHLSRLPDGRFAADIKFDWRDQRPSRRTAR
jgi:hypothetical protein